MDSDWPPATVPFPVSRREEPQADGTAVGLECVGGHVTLGGPKGQEGRKCPSLTTPPPRARRTLSLVQRSVPAAHLSERLVTDRRSASAFQVGSHPAGLT